MTEEADLSSEELLEFRLKVLDEVVDQLVAKATQSGYRVGWAAGAIFMFEALRDKKVLTAEGQSLDVLKLILKTIPGGEMEEA